MLYKIYLPYSRPLVSPKPGPKLPIQKRCGVAANSTVGGLAGGLNYAVHRIAAYKCECKMISCEIKQATSCVLLNVGFNHVIC